MRQERSIVRAIMNHTYIEELHIFEIFPRAPARATQDNSRQWSVCCIHTYSVAPEQTVKHKRPFLSLPPSQHQSLEIRVRYRKPQPAPLPSYSPNPGSSGGKHRLYVSRRRYTFSTIRSEPIRLAASRKDGDET